MGTTGDSNLDVWGRYHQKIYWRILDYAIILGFGYLAFFLSEKANSKKNNS